jgi:hypothetical protein
MKLTVGFVCDSSELLKNGGRFTTLSKVAVPSDHKSSTTNPRRILCHYLEKDGGNLGTVRSFTNRAYLQMSYLFFYSSAAMAA